MEGRTEQVRLDSEGSERLARGRGGEEDDFRDILAWWGECSWAGEGGSTVVTAGQERDSKGC